MRHTSGSAFSYFVRLRVRRLMRGLALLAALLVGYASSSGFVSFSWAASPILPELGNEIPVLGVKLPPVENTSAKDSVECPTSPFWLPCNPPYIGFATSAAFSAMLLGNLDYAARSIEEYLGKWVHDGMMASFLTTINQAEINLIDWWDTFWFYNLHPALQDVMKQISVNYADQVRFLQSGQDAALATEGKRVQDRSELDAARAYAPDETLATMATLVGGQLRANAIGRAMQRALVREGAQQATGTTGTAAAGGPAEAQRERYERYKRTFCDPNSYAGKNNCSEQNGSSPQYRNIDTQINKQVFARLTIDLQGSAAKPAQTASAENPALSGSAQAAVSGPTLLLDGPDTIPVETIPEMRENLLGTPVMEPLSGECLKGACQESFLKRRSYIARYNLIGGPFDLAVGRRMPGSQMGQWVKEVRMGAGVTEAKISPNPSSLEIMHTLTRDVTGPGFAMKQVTDQPSLKKKNLSLNILYLQQQWEQYEQLQKNNIVLAAKIAMKMNRLERKICRAAKKIGSDSDVQCD